MLDINGNMYQFDVLKETYGIKGISLIRKIPNNWKKHKH